MGSSGAGRRRRRREKTTTHSAALIVATLPGLNQRLSLEATGEAASAPDILKRLLTVVERWCNSISRSSADARSGEYPNTNSVVQQEATTRRSARLPFRPLIPLIPLQSAASFCTSDGMPEDLHPLIIAPQPSTAPPSPPLDVGILGKLTRDEKEHLADRTHEDTAILIKAAKDAASVGRGGSSRSSTVPLRFRVLLSALPPHLKLRVASRLEKMGDGGGGDNLKYAAWVEALLAVPLSRFVYPVAGPSSTAESQQVGAQLRSAKDYMDSVVFGHRGAKQAILERLYAWISSPQSPQRPLALWGPPGNGKTTLARKGLAVVMGRPFSFIGLGGGADASYLLGHGYTYEGSQAGRIVECLSQAGAMNPVLYFDELDKLSGTARGDEVANVLVHLTDTTQNDIFRDRYLHGLDLDLRGVLLVFSFNDKTSIPPVLLDRLDIVETEPFTKDGQRAVLKDYVLPELLAEANAPKGSFRLDAGALDALLEKVDASSGVRTAKAVMQQLLAKALIMRDTNGDEDLLYPLKPGAFTIRDGEIWASRDAVEAVCSATINSHGSRPPMCMYS